MGDIIVYSVLGYILLTSFVNYLIARIIPEKWKFKMKSAKRFINSKSPIYEIDNDEVFCYKINKYELIYSSKITILFIGFLPLSQFLLFKKYEIIDSIGGYTKKMWVILFH